MSKRKRQDLILEIISSFEIDTQEELVEKLNSYGYNVTQATMSRDVKELGLQKVAGKIKKLKYAKIVQHNTDDQKLLGLFKLSVKDVIQAQNIVVIKAMPGNGGVIGLTVDSLHFSEIIGSVAGDDTILVVTANNEDAERVVYKLKELM